MMFIPFLFFTLTVGQALTPNSSQPLLRASFSDHDAFFSLSSISSAILDLKGSLPYDIIVNFTATENSIVHPVPGVLIPANSEPIQKINITLVPSRAGNGVLNAVPYLAQSNKTVNSTEVDFGQAFLRMSVPHNYELEYFSDVIGWMYFAAWSVSFYPQMLLNYKRKSVIGLNFDFLALNVVGFLCYSLFNLGLYFIPAIENEYFLRHPYGVNPVQLNDVIFSAHALFACLIQVVQCTMYDKGQQVISSVAKFILYTIGVFVFVSGVICITSYLSLLDFLYFLSMVKLFITLIKYIPQMYYNHIRRSTSGWSIGNVLLDFTGGSLSILQMFIISFNYNDFGSIFGDFTKFGLGLISILFDVIFILQHYVFFKDSNNDRQPLYSPVSSYQEEHVTDSTNSRGYGAVSMHS